MEARFEIFFSNKGRISQFGLSSVKGLLCRGGVNLILVFDLQVTATSQWFMMVLRHSYVKEEMC